MAAYLKYAVEKLVRHRIVEKIEEEGNRPVTKQLRGSTHYRHLIAKLFEEAKEVKHAETREDLLEELSDVVEVCYALARKVGYTSEELTIARVQKYIEKGGFDEGVFLEQVHLSPSFAAGVKHNEVR